MRKRFTAGDSAREAEIARLLLGSSADISLHKRVWLFHKCPGKLTEVYLKVRSGLRDAAAELERRVRVKEAASRHRAIYSEHDGKLIEENQAEASADIYC